MSSNGGAPEEEGFVDSWKNWFVAKSDGQRKMRLGECRQLEAALASCRRRRNELRGQEDPDLEPFNDVERTAPGVRALKLFGWRGMLKGEEDDDEPSGPDPLKRAIAFSCAREQHALWACRSLALGCGSHLKELRECFRKCVPKDEASSALKVVTEPETDYESRNSARAICGDLQRTMGSCVTDSANGLLKREKERMEKK